MYGLPCAAAAGYVCLPAIRDHAAAYLGCGECMCRCSTHPVHQHLYLTKPEVQLSDQGCSNHCSCGQCRVSAERC